MSAIVSPVRRLLILTVLADMPEYRANGAVLLSACQQLGVPSTSQDIESELHWLQRAELVALETLGAITVAEATTRGVDVAAGRIRIVGVQRPSARG